jgi:L,D-transpeptidase YnhG
MTWDLKNIRLLAACTTLAVGLSALPANSENKRHHKAAETVAAVQHKSSSARQQHRRLPPKADVDQADNRSSQPEARLIDIYKLIGQARTREALPLAEKLVHEHPNFQLAQLVYGDLLTAQLRPVLMLGDVPDTTARAGALALAELRRESQLRLQALRDRPAPGLIPSQLISLSAQNKHAIAIDASRSRLYLFENSTTGLKLLGDYYISVGKSGIEKTVEGDLRTPLGVYFVTSNLDPKSLKNFYGSGALPINYPNQLDIKRGKTGGGIWLHGTPPEQFSRPPLATDGCVVLANPDLERIIRTVQVRTTPVVIAQSLKWVAPQTIQAANKPFEAALKAWQSAKSSGDMARLLSWYTPDFTSYGKTLAQWTPSLQAEMKKLDARSVELKDVSYLHWTDSNDTMVVTFGEVPQGAKTGQTKRQYWMRQGDHWKIFFEGVIG